jgi:hypothetical protein
MAHSKNSSLHRASYLGIRLLCCINLFAFVCGFGCNYDRPTHENSANELEPNLPPDGEPDNDEMPAPYDWENAYHWDGRSDPFFEGWYYNVKDPTSGRAWFFIYGVMNPGNPKTGLAFVHFGPGENNQTFVVDFPTDEFTGSSTHCDVAIGDLNG